MKKDTQIKQQLTDDIEEETMSWSDKLIIRCFKPWLDQYDPNIKIIRVKGWGHFLLESPTISRRSVMFAWYQGLI